MCTCTVQKQALEGTVVFSSLKFCNHIVRLVVLFLGLIVVKTYSTMEDVKPIRIAEVPGADYHAPIVRYFDPSILKWKSNDWSKLNKFQKEKILYDFWVQTSWGTSFPWTMNLFWERHATGIGALGAFMGLFSPGRKVHKCGLEEHVKWVTIKKSDPVRVKLTWTDQWMKENTVDGSGETIDLARTNAAQKAMKITFGEEDLKILKHIHSPFIYQNLGLDLKVLWAKLKSLKKGPEYEINAARIRKLKGKGPRKPKPSASSPANLPEPEHVTPDDAAEDSFAEFFSNNDDGTLDIPEWLRKNLHQQCNTQSNASSAAANNNGGTVESAVNSTEVKPVATLNAMEREIKDQRKEYEKDYQAYLAMYNLNAPGRVLAAIRYKLRRRLKRLEAREAALAVKLENDP